MNKNYCPNYDKCTLVHDSGFSIRELIRKNYIKDYCEGEDGEWKNCKRYIVKNALKFCPPSVLPDSELTVDEIMDNLTGDILTNTLNACLKLK